MQELERQLVGVQPLGACFQAGCKNVRNAGLGKLASFSDEHVLSVLACLGAKDLIRLSSVSKALYCFANHEELWKAVIIQVRTGALVAPGFLAVQACFLHSQFPFLLPSCTTRARAENCVNQITCMFDAELPSCTSVGTKRKLQTVYGI